MALKILKGIKKPVSIQRLIHERLAGWEPPRSHTTMHASDLMKDKEFCPREHAFLDMEVAKKKSEFIGTALRMTFDHGRDIEQRIRDEYLRDIAVGYWKCGVCSTRHHLFGKAPRYPGVW